MKRKSTFRGLNRGIPSSSHPEAEAGVRLSAPAVYLADSRRRTQSDHEVQKPIVSISGRDVEEIPDTNVRAA
jgi:hypothetical protein